MQLQRASVRIVAPMYAGPQAAGELAAKIDSEQATIAVIGMGYVGLPLALAYAERGFPVIGLDVDPKKVEILQAGRCYIQHIGDERIQAATRGGCFRSSDDFDLLGEADVVLICVPTPLSVQRDPDLSYVRSSAESIRDRLRPGQLIVLESTTYPGTTDELVRSVLDARGLALGSEYFLAFSPEREDPGNPDYSTTTIPKVVGGSEPHSGDLAEALYRKIVGNVVRVSSAAAAEATKLTENIFRAVNIALVNELKVIYEHMGVDIWEVLDAAATKPFGFMRFNPGPGWGGHCIPLDPYYLAWKAREYGLDTHFIELAGQINRSMPRYALERLQLALNGRGRALRGSRVLVLGMAYKKNVGDTRESPSFEIMKLLHAHGASVEYHDPFVPELPQTRNWPGHPAMSSLPLTAATLARQDAVMLVTDHTDVDYDLVREHAPLIVDTRGVYRGSDPNVIRA